MSTGPTNNPNPQGGDPGAYTQEVKHSQVSARVPEKVGRGVFSTGVLVMQGQSEFVLDFVLRMSHPHHVAARVVLPISVMPSFIGALRDNLAKYQQSFGNPPPLPTPPPGTPMPSVEEIYDGLKLPDDMLSGSYANAVMIAHSPSDFAFDFITNFYPRSSVSCRVYLSAPQIPGLLNNLTRSFQQYQQKVAAAGQQQQAQTPPPPPMQRPPDYPSPGM